MNKATTAYYVAQRAKADKKIRKKGQVGTIRQLDPAGATLGEFAVAFVVLEYSDQARDGDLIRPDDRKATVSALAADGKTPIPPITAEDRLIDANGHAFDIVANRPLSPAGIDVYYDLQIRG